MVLSLASYLLWGLSVVTVKSAGNPILSPFGIAAILTGVTLASLGLSLTLYKSPITPENLVWIPFIYFYWLLQTVVAAWSLLQILLRRPRVWRKTEKNFSPRRS